MRSLLLLILVFFSSNIHAQKKGKQTFCSEIINNLSYFWKLDSLGTNGFRYYTYKQIIESTIGILKTDSLIAKFGQPNQKLKSTKDVTYIYYYLNPPKMSKGFDAPLGIFYIGFIQKKGEDMISQITDWSADL